LQHSRQSHAGSPSREEMAKRLAPVLASVPRVPMTQRIVICFSCGDVCVLYE
jgi:hypothetical protein